MTYNLIIDKQNIIYFKSKASDIYSLGCLFHYMLAGGVFPFNMQMNETGKCIFETRFDFSLLLNQALRKQLAKVLIFQMITSQPDERPDIIHVNKHDFFKDADILVLFILNIKKKLESKNEEAKQLETLLNQDRTVIFGNWINCIDGPLKMDIGNNKYDPKKLTELIRYIRNKWTHSGEWNEEIKLVFGDSAETFLNYWSSSFPKFWQHLNKVLDSHEFNPKLLKKRGVSSNSYFNTIFEQLKWNSGEGPSNSKICTVCNYKRKNSLF